MFRALSCLCLPGRLLLLLPLLLLPLCSAGCEQTGVTWAKVLAERWVVGAGRGRALVG